MYTLYVAKLICRAICSAASRVPATTCWATGRVTTKGFMERFGLGSAWALSFRKKKPFQKGHEDVQYRAKMKPKALPKCTPDGGREDQNVENCALSKN